MRSRVVVPVLALLWWSSFGCGNDDDPSPAAQAGSAGLAGDVGTGGSAVATGGRAGAPAAGRAGEGGGGSSAGGEDAGQAGAAEEPVSYKLRLMSFNTPSFPAELAASDIAAADADVVGLQEVSPTEAATICATLGPEWTFVQEDRANLFAIVSRLPILQRIGVTDDVRGGIGATVQVAPGVRAHVFTTHGMYTPYGPYQLGVDGMSVSAVLASEEQVRMPALRELLGMMEPFLASAETTFLTGDFNAPSHRDYDPPVAWPTSVAVEQAGLVDSYAELQPGNPKRSACEFAIDDPGVTWTQLPEAEPNDCYDRIDFIHYSENEAVPLESRTIDVSASDHRAVLTELQLRAPSRSELPQLQLPRPGAEQQPRHPLLTWTPAKSAVSEQLFFWTEPGDVAAVDVTDGQYRPDLLAANQLYSWRVESVTAQGTVTGATSTFTTRASAGMRTLKVSFTAREAISVEFDGADDVTDWIALYPRGSAYGTGNPAPSWKYTNDTVTAPVAVMPSGSVTLSAASAGPHSLRFFDRDGYAVEDEIFIDVQP